MVPKNWCPNFETSVNSPEDFMTQIKNRRKRFRNLKIFLKQKDEQNYFLIRKEPLHIYI